MEDLKIDENTDHYILTLKDYEQGLRAGKMLGLRCRNCGEIMCPPMPVCCGCGGKELEKTEMGGEGELMAFTITRVPPEGMDAPYIVCLVKLSEGPWVMGRLDHDPEKITPEMLGRKVKVSGAYAWSDKFSAGEHTCPVFKVIP